MIKATVQEVRLAFAALSRIFEQTKLDQKSAWRISRMLGKLKGHVRDFERVQLKLYMDAGGIIDGRGITINPPQPKQADETLAEYERRLNEYRERTSRLSREIDALNECVVEVDYDPIPISLLPKERKNEKGENEPVEYSVLDLVEAGPFIVDDSAEKE